MRDFEEGWGGSWGLFILGFVRGFCVGVLVGFSSIRGLKGLGVGGF